jgi:hypothetical protein
MRRSRDWYTVVYQLAAQRTNNALTGGKTNKVELQKADGECQRLLNAAARTVVRQRINRANLDDGGLVMFLRQTLIPSVCVLWAGVNAALGIEGDPDFEVSLKRLSTGKALRPSPDRLVEFAKAQGSSYRLHYNLACFYTTRAETPDLTERKARLGKAEDELRQALDSVFGATRTYVLTKATSDDSLTLLRNERPGLLAELAEASR